MAEKFTEEEISKFKEAFGLFDRDDSGKIMIKELGTVMRSLGLSPSEEYLAEIVSGIETECKDVMDFPEFLTIMGSNVCGVKANEEEIYNAFRVFDRDGSGFISSGEFRHVMTNLGEKLTDDEVDEIMREAGINGAGQINYEEFISMVMEK